jgi:hypothetical protein
MYESDRQVGPVGEFAHSETCAGPEGPHLITNRFEKSSLVGTAFHW